MSQLSAAENLSINIDNGSWQLFARDEEGNSTQVVNITQGDPVRYSEEFARSRRLPSNGVLPVEYIRQVILGWSNEDACWHLGLLLINDLASARGSRWCEIASWPDPERNVFLGHAREAGESLSRTLNLPFGFIEPRAQPSEEKAPPPPLDILPINVGMWTADMTGDNQIQIVRERRWVTRRLFRIVWYSLLVIAYIVLSLTTLTTDLALPNAGTMLPNPELLPYLGLVVAVILSGIVLYSLYEILTKPNRIVIDGEAQSIIALKGKSPRWERSVGDVQSLYVTQEVNKRGKKRTIYHGELNLHLGGGDFLRLFHHDEIDLSAPADPDREKPREEIVPLDHYNAETDLQMVGLHIAETLNGMACWYDQRTR